MTAVIELVAIFFLVYVFVKVLDRIERRDNDR